MLFLVSNDFSLKLIPELSSVQCEAAIMGYYFVAARADLAGNVFASMDKDLSASGDDDAEETHEKTEDEQTEERELQHDSENNSVAASDELASNLSEDIDEGSFYEDDGDAADSADDFEHENDTAGVDSGGEDPKNAADDDGDGDVSGKMCFCAAVYIASLSHCGRCCYYLTVFSN